MSPRRLHTTLAISLWVALWTGIATGHEGHHGAGRPTASKVVKCSLDLPDGLPRSFSVVLPSPDRDLTIQLEKNSVFGKNTRFLVADGSGPAREIDHGPDGSYLGRVAEHPTFAVSAVLTNAGLVAHIIRPGRESITVEPWRRVEGVLLHRISVPVTGDHETQPPPPPVDAAIFTSELETGGMAASIGPITTLFLSLPPGDTGDDDESTATLPPTKVMDVLEYEIGVEIGSKAFLASDTYNSNMATAQASAQSLVTNLDSRFLRSAGIKHRLGTVMIRTDAGTDPLRDTVTQGNSSSLSNFKNYWNANPGEVGNTHDLAVYHVKYPPSGIAYVNSVGTSSRYALSCGNSTWSWADGTIAHEFGHSWNLRHTGDSPISEYDYNSGNQPPSQFYEAKPRDSSGADSADGSHTFVSIMHGGGDHNIGRLASDEANTAYSTRENKRGHGDLVGDPGPINPFGQRDSYTIPIGIPTTIDPVANDYDCNNDVLDVQLFDTVSHRGGTIALSEGTGPGGRSELVYTSPAEPSADIDFFHYKVFDTTGRTDWGAVYVTLVPDPTPKEINPASFIADSIEGWVPEAQEANGWQYGMQPSGSFTQLTATPVDTFPIGGDRRTWKNGSFSPVAAQYAMYPGSGTNASIKRWTSDYDGLATIHLSSLRMQSGGNGQTVAIEHNGTQIFSQSLSDGNPQDFSTIDAVLEVGDTIDLLVHSDGDNTFDWTAAHLRIVRADHHRDDSSLLFHFPLDETAYHPDDRREVAADHSGNNRHAELIDGDASAAWTAGHIANAFRADNSGVHLRTGYHIGDGADELTLSVWIKPDSKDDNDAAVSTTGPDFNGIIFTDGTNPLQFRLKSNGLSAPDGSGPLDKWTHAVGTWKAGEFQRLYLDGVEVAEDTTPPTGALDVDRWLIGKDREFTNRHFDGLIDDVALWSRALDAAEIRALYQQGADARDINGVDDVVQLPYTPVENGGTELTLSAWVKPRDKADNDGIISCTGPSYHALLFKGVTGRPAESRAMSNPLAATADSAPVNQWTQITSVWQSGQLHRLYLDGVEAVANPSPPGGSIDATDWFIGRDRLTDSRIFDGLLGEPVILGRALSDGDVAALEAAGRTNHDAGHGFFARSGHVGSSSSDSHFAEAAGVFTLSGVGTGIGGTSDDFEFAARQFSGAYQLEARLEDFHGAGPGSEAGVMIRDSLEPGAKFVYLRATPDQTLTLERRHTTDAATVIDTSLPAAAPPGTFLRLSKIGSHFIASYSADGTNFTTLGSGGVNMVNNAHAGLVMAAASSTTPGTAQFSHVGINPPDPDSDGDGLLDSWELAHFGNLTTSSGSPGEDFDKDTLDDAGEHAANTDPTLVDTDGDGTTDGNEIHNYPTDPLNPDSDGDGYPDGFEIAWGSSPILISEVPTIPGLVAYYPCNEGSGTTAFDLASNDGAQDAVENQNTIGWTTGGITGAALDLPGNASLVAADAIPPGATALTICAWVNPDATGGYKGIFAGRQNPGNWGLDIEDTHADFRFANTSGTSFGIDSPVDSITASSGWHHLAITWQSDGSSTTSSAYLDGAPLGTPGTGARVDYASPTLGYFIGDDPCCGSREFNGQIDEIAVFSTALTTEHIALIHSEGQAGRDILGTLQPDTLTFTESSVDSASGDVTLTWNSTGGAAFYSVLSTTDLTLPLENWTVVEDNLPNTGDTTSYTHADAALSDTTRFYVISEN